MSGPQSRPDVSVVFTNWNTREYMRDCIKSLKEKTSGITYEIIVVDDGSTDGSVEMLRKEFPEVINVVNEKNLGVAKAYNRGVAAASGKYIQMLNTDMLLLNNAIKILYDFLESHPEAGACAGWLKNRDLSSQISYGSFPSISQALVDAFFLNDIFPHAGLPARGKPPAEDSKEPFLADYVTGASMLIRKELIDKLGFMDERYTSYCEEVDFCYRVTHEAGAKIYLVPAAQIIHFGGASFGKVRRYQVQLHYSSYNKFLRKYHNPLYALCFRVIYTWHYSLKAMVRFLRFLTAPGDRKEVRKNDFLNAWYIMRFSLFPDETFSGK